MTTTYLSEHIMSEKFVRMNVNTKNSVNCFKIYKVETTETTQLHTLKKTNGD